MGNGLCGSHGLFGDSTPTSPAARGPGPDERHPHRSSVPAEPPRARSVPEQLEVTPAPPVDITADASARPSPATAARQQPSAPSPAPVSPRVPLMASTPANRKAAEDLKTEGNALFTKGKFAAAIEKYTEAITLCPDWAVLYVNRGMAARKRGEWERVESDAGAALQLSPAARDAMKGHYLLGLAMGARGQHDGSTQHLRKALDAAREANDSIKDEIWRELATANYQQWLARSTARRAQHKQLRRRLAELLGLPVHSGGEEAPLPSEWAALFSAAAREDTAAEAPSQFTCPLTMEIFRDPVVVPSGRSYERSALLEHLKKVGRFDPITRQQLSEELLVPNVSLRAAIEVYLEEHPWAWGEVK